MNQQPKQNKTAEFKRWNDDIKTLIAGHRGIFSREVHWTECVPALAGYVGQQTASLQKQRDEAITNLENCESLKTFIEQKEQIKSLQKQLEEQKEEIERLRKLHGVIAKDFFYWWANTAGIDTEDGYESYLKTDRYKALNPQDNQKEK